MAKYSKNQLREWAQEFPVEKQGKQFLYNSCTGTYCLLGWWLSKAGVPDHDLEWREFRDELTQDLLGFDMYTQDNITADWDSDPTVDTALLILSYI